MKRCIIIALALSIIGSLCACNSSGSTAKNNSGESSSAETKIIQSDVQTQDSSSPEQKSSDTSEKSSAVSEAKKESSLVSEKPEESSAVSEVSEESSEVSEQPEESSTVSEVSEESSEISEQPEEISEESQETDISDTSEEESSDTSDEESSEDTSSTPSPPSSTEIQYIDGAASIDGILIVNKTYALPEDYGYGEDSEALNAFYQMQNDAYNDGIYLEIISGFRSYQTQVYTYNSFVLDRGTELADRVSARPGHSEHQTGLAFDINTTANYFADTPEAAWLEEHCAEYGFIIRYPRNKEDVTGYAYEPWHIRYIGKEKARIITASGLTLEEYYGLTSFYS